MALRLTIVMPAKAGIHVFFFNKVQVGAQSRGCRPAPA
jgi:hypothetical protein